MGDSGDKEKEPGGSFGWKTKAIYVTAGATTFAIAAPFVAGAIGFGTVGIAGGSTASAIMASYGGLVTKGSICALLQSAGATGTIGTTGFLGSALLGGGIGGAASVASEKIMSKFWKKKPVKSNL